jgi:hypothetical protein
VQEFIDPGFQCFYTLVDFRIHLNRTYGMPAAMEMVSKYDLLVGILILIAGIFMYESTPASAAPGAGGLFMAGAAHATSHYIGAALAIIFGLVGLALYRKVNKVTVPVSVLSIIIGIVFAIDAPGMPSNPALQPHGAAMAGISGITLLIGIIGIIGSAVIKTSTTTVSAKTEAVTAKH